MLMGVRLPPVVPPVVVSLSLVRVALLLPAGQPLLERLGGRVVRLLVARAHGAALVVAAAQLQLRHVQSAVHPLVLLGGLDAPHVLVVPLFTGVHGRQELLEAGLVADAQGQLHGGLRRPPSVTVVLGAGGAVLVPAFALALTVAVLRLLSVRPVQLHRLPLQKKEAVDVVMFAATVLILVAVVLVLPGHLQPPLHRRPVVGLLVPRDLRAAAFRLHAEDEQEPLHEPVHLLHLAEATPVRLPNLVRRLVLVAGVPDGLLGLVAWFVLLGLRSPVIKGLALAQAVSAHVMPWLRLLLRTLAPDVAVDAAALAVQQRLTEPLFKLRQQVVLRLVLLLLLLPLALKAQGGAGA